MVIKKKEGESIMLQVSVAWSGDERVTGRIVSIVSVAAYLGT